MKFNLDAKLRRGNRFSERHLVELISFDTGTLVFQCDLFPLVVGPRKNVPRFWKYFLTFVTERGRGLSFVEPVDACVLEGFRFCVFKLNPLRSTAIRMKAQTRNPVVGGGGRLNPIDQSRGVRSRNR